MGARKCHLCDATDHAFCGFCADCKEHTAFHYECIGCGEPADGGKCRVNAGGPHEADDQSEAVSLCCGASGYAYDHDPT